VNVWASWCGPCRKEMPELVDLERKYRKKDLMVVGVSVDEDKDKWLKAIASDGQHWQQFCELKPWLNTTMAQNWGVIGIPYNYLIDKEGILVGKELSVPELYTKLRQLIP